MMEKVSTVLLTIYALAHALIVLSLAAFGLRADGWVLHPVAVSWYGLFVLGGFALLVRSWRVEAHHWLPVIPPMWAPSLPPAPWAARPTPGTTSARFTISSSR